MKHLIFWLLVAPLTVAVMLPLFAVGAVAAVVWICLRTGWNAGWEYFEKTHDFVQEYHP